MATITGKTIVLGVIGDPVSHSDSPAMHNAALLTLGLPMVYLPIHIQHKKALDSFFAWMRFSNVNGVNVTIPYKEAIVPYLDKLDASAQGVQAVNTVVKRGSKLYGYNTDGDGFLLSIKKEWPGLDIHGRDIAVIGAGGAARGLIGSLLEAEAGGIHILNRNIDKAKALVASFPVSLQSKITVHGNHESCVSEVCSGCSLVVNTTPVGMATPQDANPLESPVSTFDWVSPEHYCYDMVYKPRKTLFLKQCESRGAYIMGGAGMLAGQGALAFALFTGKKITYAFMKGVLHTC